ncbi:hypothetical protein [Photorhabdus sp. RW14-46]|uniref:hypothetical protein n=1 Tax=Photorhabdus sp. RW14-46 TaxID=2100168 RepID=UPI0013F49261|nr:hypothetical protein [Photorhabdus sp. RW14-46]
MLGVLNQYSTIRVKRESYGDWQNSHRGMNLDRETVMEITKVNLNKRLTNLLLIRYRHKNA